MAAKFRLGDLRATPAALAAIDEAGQEPAFFLNRHLIGDWGDVPEEDRQANLDALAYGSRIISAYHTLGGERIWIITEADRSATTLLLPSEY